MVRMSDRRGFTLIEIVIAIAIVAILAGTVTPLVFKQVVKAREDATLTELSIINNALVEFYEDTGRFPTEIEGLSVLVSDPGISGWQGPYVGGERSDPVHEVSTDCFGEDYVYDLDPITNPAGAADVLLASPGVDFSMTFGSLNSTWTLDTDGDDLLSLVTAGPINRDKMELCQEELSAIGVAAGLYFEDNAAFPVTVDDLNGEYLDEGIGGSNFVDPWNTSYVFGETGGGGTPVVFLARSFGPDRNNDDGGGDDYTLNVSSIPPGRKSTIWKLGIVQTMLNNNASVGLTGDWDTDRPALGLADAFTLDGWGQALAVNVSSRTIYSMGPDGNAALVSDNLPSGVGP